MNLLFFTRNSVFGSERFGGAETSIKRIADGFVQRGHRVSYFAFTEKDSSPWSSARDGMRVFLFHPTRPVPRWALRRTYRGNDFPARVRQALYTVIKKQKIDVVYAHYDVEVLRALLDVRERIPFKLVIRMSGLKWFYEIGTYPETREDYEMIFREADSINFLCHGLKTLARQRAEQIGLPLSPRHEFIADIGVSLDVPERRIRREHESDGVLRAVVATGFYHYAKRQDLIVEAVQRIGTTVDVEVLMIGSGPEREKIEKQIQQQGVGDRIRIMSFLPQEEMWAYLQDADLLLHACDYEGVSKIILESMTMGLPVLASNVLPLGDYIQNGRTGFLVENDPEAWAEKMVELCNDRSLLQQVAAQAKEYAREAFDMNRNVILYEEAFTGLINR